MREDKLYRHWIDDKDPNRAWLARLCEGLYRLSTTSPFVRGAEFVPDWHEYFYAIAEVVSLRSKDQNRGVGAVIVQDGIIVSTGYNGFPRGVREYDDRTATASGAPDVCCPKYAFTTHAEENAIFNAARLGVSLVGATIYVTTFPCTKCARAIVQAGIGHVYTYGDYWKKDPEGWERALEILEETGINVQRPTIRRVEADASGDHGDAVLASSPPMCGAGGAPASTERK